MNTTWIKVTGMVMAAVMAMTLVSCTKKKGDESETTPAVSETTTTATSGAAVRTGSEGLSFTVTGSGETAVEYPHQTKHYIDSQIAAAVALALGN